MKGYLANNLFDLGNRIVNELIAKEIRSAIPSLKLYNPMENNSINDKSQFANSIMIVDGDLKELYESDLFIAVLDSMDEGMLVELGIAFESGKKIVALSTDIRTQGRNNKEKIDAFIEDPFELQWRYFNLFVIGIIKKSNGKICTSVDELVETIKEMG
jgi:nucleoside 2-deoxyribosyltransferase